MRSPTAALLALALATGACTPVLDEGPVLASRTSDVTLARITEQSAGGIDGSTTYSQKAIAAALPGFTTEGLQSATENDTEWVIGAFNSDGFQVLQVYKGDDGKVREVHGVTHHLQGPDGVRIGMTFQEAGMSRSDCRVGRNLWIGMAICPAPSAPNVKLLFAIPQFNGPFDELAPASELKRAELQRIVWTPPSPHS
ncbi:DUF1131 family protein [Stappia sp. F7233]|uniref:DUF1131 family protein n=1 Tax=Stappia albiluteola TaxID=2758565 RepID=A0A839AJY3_9HYPH|nr:DUF1131 family protein [Stappia albiluteola]MBA5779087.1 DUF1131 family protein [Stappia albiluteola]